MVKGTQMAFRAAWTPSDEDCGVYKSFQADNVEELLITVVVAVVDGEEGRQVCLSESKTDVALFSVFQIPSVVILAETCRMAEPMFGPR